MKSLIRLMLIATARLVLFLSAVAWISGQWFRLEEQTELSNSFTLRAVLQPDGIIIRYADDRFMSVAMALTGEEDFDLFAPYQFHFSQHEFPWAIKADQTESYLAFRHWFVFSVAFAINLLLHFIYRKRQRPEPT